MSAGQHNFTCLQGETFRRNLTWKTASGNVNVTGYAGRMQIRSAPNGVVLAELSSATGKDGTITFGTTNGAIVLLLPAAKTAILLSGALQYDLLVTAPGGGGDTTALLEGTFNVIPAVTHD